MEPEQSAATHEERIPPDVIVVLLVDDQPMIGEVVRRMLAGEPNMEFHYCRNPEEAVTKANQTRPAVILQDLVMPKIDGLEMVRLFRANPATAETPIIVLSAEEDPEIKSQALAAGANDYMGKLPARSELIAGITHHAKDRSHVKTEEPTSSQVPPHTQ